MKKKQLNITCFCLLIFEIVSIIFCLGTQIYAKYTINNDQTLINLICTLRLISYLLFSVIILISIIHFIKNKRITIINILIIIIAIFPLIYETDKKDDLWPTYSWESGGNRIVLEKGHDIFGYFIKVDILYIPEWAESNPDETIDKVYCKKEDYDKIDQYELYNMYYSHNELIEWGVLEAANEPAGDPWTEHPKDRFPPKYTPEDFE